PASSGTGYLDVTAWMQIWGEKQAWDYMQALDKNISQYPHSGSKPCKMAAQGEIPIGVSFGYPFFVSNVFLSLLICLLFHLVLFSDIVLIFVECT
ncbi:hypothetical protein V2W52_19995, partial [Acinetobacter baumannii]